MKLPEGTHLAYAVAHEAWYSRIGPMMDDPPTIFVMASHPEGGCVWEFRVEGTRLGLWINMFDDSWEAYAHIPEFFAALAELGRDPKLTDVEAVLTRLGAVDETVRERPIQL